MKLSSKCTCDVFETWGIFSTLGEQLQDTSNLTAQAGKSSLNMDIDIGTLNPEALVLV